MLCSVEMGEGYSYIVDSFKYPSIVSSSKLLSFTVYFFLITCNGQYLFKHQPVAENTVVLFDKIVKVTLICVTTREFAQKFNCYYQLCLGMSHVH